MLNLFKFDYSIEIREENTDRKVYKNYVNDKQIELTLKPLNVVTNNSFIATKSEFLTLLKQYEDTNELIEY